MRTHLPRRYRRSTISMDAVVGTSLLLASLAMLWAYAAFALSHDCKFVSAKSTALQHLCSLVGF